MHRYTVTARGLSSVEVEARNWVVALGHGLAELGRDQLERLACEVLPNGTVIARDIASGTGYVVQEMDEESDGEQVDDPASAVDEPAFALSDEDDLDDTLGLPDIPTSDEESELLELPVDALQPLDPMEHLRHTVGDAETVIMASALTLQAAIDLIPAESGAVILEERGHMQFTSVHGPFSRKLMGVRLPLGTGVAGFALEHGRTIVLGNAHDDPRHCGEVDALTGYQTQAIAVVPIQKGDRTYGVLELLNLPEPERFTEDRVAQLQTIAGCLAARLHEDEGRAKSDPLDRR